MAPAKSPAFQFYAADYLADENVALMTLEEEGAYIRAMSYCWREGSIPADPEMLSRLLKGASMSAVKVVAARFKVSPNDASRLVHLRLDAERKKQAIWKQKSAEAGKKSGKVRREKKFHAELTFNQPSDLVEPNTNSSSSSSSSIAKEQKQKPLAKDKPSPDPRAQVFRASFGNYFQTLNNAPAPWDAKEATRLRDWLVANPSITPEQWSRILNNRRRSPVAHGKRLSVWIDTALSWLQGPADEWGKAITNTGAANVRTNANLEALRQSLAAEEDQDGPHSDGDDARGEAGRRNNLALFRTLSSRVV